MNAQIDPAAAIAYSKLALTGSVVNADIAPAAAIAYPKLNLAASIASTDMAAGNKRTVSTLAGGPPASPSTGDIWIATAVDANGTCWQFCYNSAETTYKWEFIGGLEVLTGPVNGSVNSATLVAITSSPTLTLARAGDYFVRWGFWQANDGASASCALTVGVTNTPCTGLVELDYTLQSSGIGNGSFTQGIATGIAASTTLNMIGKGSGTSVSLTGLQFSVVPRRII